jgi:gas vesicle protein
MKEIVYFMLGAAVGVTFALLFAPESGAELRAGLQATAEKDLSRLQADWQAATAKTNQRLDQMQADLKQALEQRKGKEEEVA